MGTLWYPGADHLTPRAPPLIGESDRPPDSRLLGALQSDDGARLAQLPPCETATSLPGGDAVETGPLRHRQPQPGLLTDSLTGSADAAR